MNPPVSVATELFDPPELKAKRVFNSLVEELEAAVEGLLGTYALSPQEGLRPQLTEGRLHREPGDGNDGGPSERTT